MKCADHSSICPSGRNTCCYNKISPGVYGCCEDQNAVCCNDMHHCCPENYVCDSQKGICSQTIYTSQLKTTKKIAIYSLDYILCVDGSTCPDKTTCCPLITGSYGCCPYPEAKCCGDKIHCCPHGYKCDPNSNKCELNEPFSLLLVLPPLKSILCPDYTTVCLSNETCCLVTDSNSWACCPASDGVCCDNYCCQKGEICDLQEGDCRAKLNSQSKKMHYVDAIKRTKVHQNMKEDNEDIVDSFPCKIECHVDQTCCGMGLDEYGCCPKSEASCCSDGQHCCPDRYKCLSNDKCIKTEY